MIDSLCVDANNKNAFRVSPILIGTLLFFLSGGAFAKPIELHPFFCPIVSEAPEIDGVIGGDEWTGASKIGTLIGRKNKVFNDTTVYALADSSSLYIGFVCGGPDGVPVKREEKERDSLSRQDDGVGVLIDLEHDHQASELFFVGSGGAQHDAHKEAPKSGGWGDSEWSAEWSSAVHRGKDFWSAELAIPLGEIGGIDLEPGATIGVNFFRERPQLLDSQHYIPEAGGKRSAYFADMILGPPSVAPVEINFPKWQQGVNLVVATVTNFSESQMAVQPHKEFAGRIRSFKTDAALPIVFEPGETKRIKLDGVVAGDWKNRFRMTLVSDESRLAVYSAWYSFQPSTSVLNGEWTFKTSGSACLPPNRFRIDFFRKNGEATHPFQQAAAKLAQISGENLGHARAIFSRPARDILRFEIPTEELGAGQYCFFVRIKDQTGYVLFETAHFFALAGSEWKPVGENLNNLASRIDHYTQMGESGNVSVSSALLFRHYIETAQNQIKKAKIDDYEKPLNKAKKTIELAMQLAESFDAGKDPMAGKTGLLQRAFISPNDGKAYPYYVYIPESYDGSKPYPMITDLLAQLPEPDWDKPFDEQTVPYWRIVLPQLAERDFIMVWPPGVRKIEGEKNYFAILDLMKADCNIDPDGLYLIGVSGGGLSSWCIGLRYPHLIAAIAPISAVVEASGKIEPGPGGGDGTDNIDRARSALHFPMNALHIPTIILHGDSDPVTPHTTQALPMVAKMKELGLEHEYVEYSGADHGLGHENYGDAFGRALDFFEKHPNVAHPKTIDYSTWNLRYNRAYWLHIDAFETEGARARIQATANGNRVEIKTENVKAWTLLSDAKVFDLSKPIEIQINGADPVSKSMTGCDELRF